MGYTIKNIPTNWEIKPMPEVVKWGSGGTPKATVREYYENGDIPWLIIGDLNDSIVTSSATKITELGLQNSSAKIIEEGTLMVAMYGSIGKLGITGMRCCTNQAIAYAKELHGVTTKYMFYYMAMIKSELISKGKGGTQKNISQTVLNSLIVAYPPSINEQERIVAKIEELFSDLDNAVETLNATKVQLEVYKQTVLYEAFSDLSDTVDMQEIATMIDPQPSHRTPPEVVGGIPYIGIGDIDYDNNIIKFDSARKVSASVLAEHLSRYTISKGDFVMGKIGTIGKPYRIPIPQEYALSANVILIQPNHELILPDFLYWQFSSHHVTSQLLKGANATSQPAFGIKKSRLLKIKMCDFEQQRAINLDIESKISVYESIAHTVEKSLEEASAMRQSILKQAFEGRLL